MRSRPVAVGAALVLLALSSSAHAATVDRVAVTTVSPGATGVVLQTLQADGAQQRNVTYNDFGVLGANWSPDGSELVGLQLGPDGVNSIVVWRQDGSGSRVLASGSDFYQVPVWTNDGTHVARGVTPSRFAPHRSVTRAQMASFLSRLHTAIDGEPLGPRVHCFADVGTSVHIAAIERLCGAGIAGGASRGQFNPQAAVTRAQMAGFLARLLDVEVEAGHVPRAS